MKFIDADRVEAALPYPRLVDVLETAFRNGAIAPPRHHHHIPLAGRPEATWLLMPAITASAPGAATAGPYMGMKSVTVFPDNGARRGKPAIFGVYLLGTTDTGETLAIMDATRLTVLRTAAASALSARYLARPDASYIVVVGAGALAPYMVRAHASVRPIRTVRIWNRTPDHADRVAASLRASLGLDVRAVTDLEAAVREADVVSTATMSTEPLVRGSWLKPGTHVDSVGAYRKTMRETDDDLVRRARVFVDTRAGAFGEAGDILIPIEAGVIGKDAVLADLYDLTRGAHPGRPSATEITFFKSVGASIEDLAAAVAVYEAQGS
ncbi:MAG: ornithine cyclodeaminase family protein [Hyphomicrobiales bacterium]|nr:ornithine cyclodeaminase family protein [Hyphomicrobiales bacterium]